MTDSHTGDGGLLVAALQWNIPKVLGIYFNTFP